MIKTLAHACILSNDLDRTLNFYCSILGLKKKFDFYRKEEWIGYYLEIKPGQYIEVFKTGQEAKPENVRIGHFCLEVEDIDGVREKLISNGIKATEKKKGADHSWQIWCKDPDGIDIEFHHYTPESSQLVGGRCNVDW